MYSKIPSAQVGARRVHQVLRQQRHQPLQARAYKLRFAYYNREESVDGQRYVFIATPNWAVSGHNDAGDFAVHLQEMLDDGS